MPRPSRASSTSPATADRSAPDMTWAAQASAGWRRSGRAASSSSSTAAFSAADRASSTDRLSLTGVPLFAPGYSLLNFQPGVEEGGAAGLRVKASDDDLQVRPRIGPLEIGDVRLDFLQVQDPLLPGQVLVDGSRVDVVEGDPLQDVLRRVVDGH